MRTEHRIGWRRFQRGVWLAAGLAVATLGCGRAPRPEIVREWAGASYEFCIGVYTGSTPLAVGPRANRPQTPVFTGADVTSVPARFVADPFVVRRDGTWYLFFELLNAVTGEGDIGCPPMCRLAITKIGSDYIFLRPDNVCP